MNDEKIWERTCEIIPGGVQTYSKMPSKHAKAYPLWLNRGEGVYVYDTHGKKYIDYPCSLGAILLGHHHPRVTDFVQMQIEEGTIFSLPHRKEGLLAEQLVDLIPSAEQVRFLKTGSEATSAAVKIARACTGRRRILACGFHGWHDWYASSTPHNKGCMDTEVKQFKYNDLEELESLLIPRGRAKESLVAAVIMEPYVYNEPKMGYLEGVKKLCEKYGCLLIFDEVVTGFRTPGASAQKMFNVTPHLSCFGKALGNGFPISFVCGQREFMEVINDGCFVSSTFGGDVLGIAAALAVVETLRVENFIDKITYNGRRFIEEMQKVGIEVNGYPCRTYFNFPSSEHKTLFWQECIKRGVLFGYAQFMTPLHNQNVVTQTTEVARIAMQIVKDHWENPKEVLEGPAATETTRVMAEKKDETDSTDTRTVPAGEDMAERDSGDSEDDLSDDS